jgi:hypothetical protein
MLPSVWPGIANTSAPPPKSSTSPSTNSRSTGTGGAVSGRPAETRWWMGTSQSSNTGGGTAATRPDRSRVTGACKDRRSCRLVQFACGADVVDVAVRQHDALDVRRRGQDFGNRARRTGIDQRHRIPVAPGIHLPSLDPQHRQVRRHWNRLHDSTLGDCTSLGNRISQRRNQRSART